MARLIIVGSDYFGKGVVWGSKHPTFRAAPNAGDRIMLAPKTRDYQWVISQSAAMNMLFQQGYLVVKRETRRGVRWLQMMKEVEIKELKTPAPSTGGM
jgi:hypothetical protein